MTDSNELSVSRYIEAKPEMVWQVMTDRQEEWWCPKPWRVEVKVQDRRAGGRSFMVMYGPDGEEAPQDGIFLAWDEGRRFVSTDAVTLAGQGEFLPAGPFMIYGKSSPKVRARATPPARATGATRPASSTRRWASSKAGASAPTNSRRCARRASGPAPPAGQISA